MDNFIREIPSDSTIKEMNLSGNTLSISFDFDIEINGKLSGTLVFENAVALNALPGLGVEGIRINESSEYLDKVRKLLKEDGEPEKNIFKLKSYEVLPSSNEAIIEIIAETYKFIQ